MIVEAFMIERWTVAFGKHGFVVMPYSNAFMTQMDSIPKKYVSGIPKNSAQYAVEARMSGLRH